MRDHIVVLGYGTKGRNAARELVVKGTAADRIVAVDSNSDAVAAATASGHGAVLGGVHDEDVLRRALVDRARVVVVSVGRDDSAVLAALTVRRLNPTATVIAASREAHNAALLRQSGASSVVVSSETAGRLLGLAADSPRTVDVLEDLLSFETVDPARQRRRPRTGLPRLRTTVASWNSGAACSSMAAVTSGSTSPP